MVWLLVAIGVVGILLGGAFRAPALIVATAVSILTSVLVARYLGMSGAQTTGWAFGAFGILNAGFFGAAFIRMRPPRSADGLRPGHLVHDDGNAVPRPQEAASK